MEIFKELLDQFPTTVVTVCAVMSTIFLYGIMKHLEKIGMLMIMSIDKDGIQELFKEFMREKRASKK